jgi:hypothetical protein
VSDEDECGVSFDHELDVIDTTNEGTTYECRRCGAELYEAGESKP